jgi:integrase
VTTKRTTIASEGAHGTTVHVFADTLNGEPVARVEWRELVGMVKRRKTETFRGAKRDREAAAKVFAKAKAEYLRGAPVGERKRYTVADLWEAYVTANTADWRPKTAKLNASRWKVFVGPDALDPYTFADLVTPETLDSFRLRLLSVEREKTGVVMARNQVAHHIQLVKSVWRHARARKLLAENVLADYAVRKGRDYGALEVPEFSPADWSLILSQADYRSALRWRAWAAIALDGLLAPRSNALLHLTWADLDLAARLVTWPTETDKLGKRRVQPLPRAAVFALRVAKVWAARDGYTGPYVFYGAQDRSRHKAWTYSALNAALAQLCTEAGVTRAKYQSMHSLRRMRGKSVLEATGDITKVGAWLGDSDVRVLTRSYLRNRPDDLKHVVSGLSLPARTEPKTNTDGNETATATTKGRRAKPSTR